MKSTNNILVTRLAIFCFVLLAACQAERINLEDAQRRSELFLVSDNLNASEFFYVSEAELINRPVSDRILQANSIIFEQRTNWESGAREITELIESIITSNPNNELSVYDRVDLQLITYMNFQHFLSQAPSGTVRQELAASNLLILTKNCSPIDWTALSALLILAANELSIDQFTRIRDYIISGAESCLQDPANFTVVVKEQAGLQEKARVALSQLQSTSK